MVILAVRKKPNIDAPFLFVRVDGKNGTVSVVVIVHADVKVQNRIAYCIFELQPADFVL
jgi:hypothetical protein